MNTHKITTGYWRPTLEGEDLHTETREYVLLKDYQAVIVEKDKEIARLRKALEYIKINADVECNCYVEEAVNYIEPCIYCVAKNALEEK